MYDKVIWSPLAENDIVNILEYLDREWGNIVANQFINVLDHIIEQIKNYPQQFPVIYKKEKIRKCVLTKHNTLYYKISKEQIDILRIFDTRQDPRKLKFD